MVDAELAPAIRTKYEVARWAAIQTLLALGLVIPTTALGLLWLYGGDLHRSVSGLVMLRFGMVLGGIEALLFAPHCRPAQQQDASRTHPCTR